MTPTAALVASAVISFFLFLLVAPPAAWNPAVWLSVASAATGALCFFSMLWAGASASDALSSAFVLALGTMAEMGFNIALNGTGA